MLVLLNEDSTFEMEHWDVKMAFTQAPLEEELYMELPDGFELCEEEEGKKTFCETKTTHFCCRLKKSLYGLKQAAHNWQKMLVGYFTKNLFSATKADPCLFFRKKR